MIRGLSHEIEQLAKKIINSNDIPTNKMMSSESIEIMFLKNTRVKQLAFLSPEKIWFRVFNVVL